MPRATAWAARLLTRIAQWQLGRLLNCGRQRHFFKAYYGHYTQVQAMTDKA